MNFYKKTYFIGCALLLLCMPVNAQVVDKIIAIVNDEAITLAELNEAFEPYAKNIENTYKGNDKQTVIRQTKEAFVQRMIDNILIEQEAKKSGGGINVKDEEVMEVLKDMLDKRKVSLDEYVKKLAAEGNTLESVKKEIKKQLTRMRLLRREIRSKVLVTDQEIGEYYDKMRQDYEGKEAVRIKQILLLIPEGADKATKEKIKNEAQRLRKRALDGDSFDELAALYSKGPAAAQGGDVGFIEKGTIIAEVETAAFSLGLEQISEVFESSIGMHIIKVVDKRGAGLKPIAAVREEIKAKLEDEKLEKKYDEWIASVRKKSFIEVRF